jgi:hypothetical protein
METVNAEESKNCFLKGRSETLEILETASDGRFCDGKIEFSPRIERKIH